MKEKLLHTYAKLAADYEKHVDTESGVNAYYERPAMMKQVPNDLSGQTVLDAGCAAGWYTEQLIRLGAKVHAIDLSPEMADAAKRRTGGSADVRVHDLSEPLPFADQSFDCILSSLTLHYIEHWEPVFEQFRRVLKPGGKLLYSVHHPFMDMALSPQENYFARELLTDVWNKKEAGRVEVIFYRRPLHEIVNVTTAYFTLEHIIEPQPEPEFIERLPEAAKLFERLRQNPHFLIVQARK